MSFFQGTTLLPPDPIFSLPIAFAADPRPDKVNLGIGSYRDANGHPTILKCVKEAETLLLSQEQNKEYLPIDGNPTFLQGVAKLVLGNSFFETNKARIFCAQTVGGTSALRTGGDFLARQIKKPIYLPSPTWENHKQIFSHAGLEICHYSYYDTKKRCIDFSSLCQEISSIPAGSILLLHAVCHNPTGLDPSTQQWHELSTLIKQRQLLPFFDLAYQGFADNLEQDVAAIRHFISEHDEMLISVSFAKNLGLYGERVGALLMLLKDASLSAPTSSHIKQIIRSNYSNPPKHGAAIVSEILHSTDLTAMWIQELDKMRSRLKTMRQQLMEGLENKTKSPWDFLNRQRGFFSFSGLSPEQVKALTERHAIHLPASGRINVAGLNPKNINYVIDAIADVVK